MTLEERLNETIEERDSKIESLENKIDELVSAADAIKKAWMHHEEFEKTELTKDLPIPRLEMRYTFDGHNASWHYGIVYNHYWAFDESKLMFIPLGLTNGTGRYSFGETPFRDGVHILKDAKQFNMKAYLIDYSTSEIKELNS